MMAPVLSSIVLLIFPIVCNAALTKILGENEIATVLKIRGIQSTRTFSTPTNRLDCVMFQNAFSLPGQQTMFQSVGIVSTFADRNKIEYIAGDNCQGDFQTNIYADNDEIRVRFGGMEMSRTWSNTNYEIMVDPFAPSQWTECFDSTQMSPAEFSALLNGGNTPSRRCR
ncbi:uncharacterized protein LOC128999283 [Macrosteles quadrilineatus]|uniref:uncharacterized protein LOC128999283 n=1 Tax=Macrosteles quadrilineatus TaxID=74068 RepID=UPI0023E1EFF1|nr:uncharacterized protein LOC128999283 [Macrosteles quadrilineatus]